MDAIKKDAKERMDKALTSLDREFAKLRTGRASAALFDGIKVDYYGTMTPLGQLATVAVPDSRTITIQPWDRGAFGAVEKAILKSDLGLNPVNDGKILRITIPPLTEERRKELVKVAKKYTEEEIDNYVNAINKPIKRAIQEKYYYPKKALLDSLRAARAVAEFRKVAGVVKKQINDEWEANTEKITMTARQRQDYITKGGTPHLDNEYTVFGEMVEGFDVLDRIADMPTDKNNRPLQDVKIIHVKVIE